MTYPYPHIKDNVKSTVTAVLHAKKGNRNRALAQLEEGLQSGGVNNAVCLSVTQFLSHRAKVYAINQCIAMYGSLCALSPSVRNVLVF